MLRCQRRADEERLLRNLTELRHAVEPEAARLAATRASDDELDELRGAYATMKLRSRAATCRRSTTQTWPFIGPCSQAPDNDLFGSLEQDRDVTA